MKSAFTLFKWGLLTLTLTPFALGGENSSWPQFLGPKGVAASDAAIPSEFGPGKHELWKVALPEGHSSPCIWGDRLFLTGYRNDTTLVMLAVNRSNGELLWEHAFEVEGKERYDHVAACPAMPTPCTDGKHVVFAFGGYGLLAYTLKGELVWKKALPLRSPFGMGTSPILIGDALILVRDGAEDAAVLCLNVKDGSERWSRPRVGYGPSYSTPVLWENALRTELVIPGSTDLTSLDPQTGEVLWHVTNTCGLPCTTPVGTKDRLFYAAWTTMHVDGRDRMESAFDEGTTFTEEEIKQPEAFIAKFDQNQDGKIQREELPPSRAKDVFRFMDRNDDGQWELSELGMFHSGSARSGRNVMVAIKPGGKGLINDSHVVWERTKRLPYVPSPLASEGRVYIVKDGGIVSCLDGETGKAHFESKRLGVRGEFYASPIRVGDKVLLTAASGTVAVIRDGEDFEILAKNDFGEEIYATPAVVEETLYLRSKHHLWAFGKSE